MIVVMDHAPLADEAFGLIESGCTELLFPYADEDMVARYADSLSLARDVLMDAGIAFGVARKVVEW